MRQGLSVSPGYASKYAAPIVRQYARIAAANIKRRMRETGADTIVVQGTSGVSVGFAALMSHGFPLVMVRKPEENSHGSPVEGPREHRVKRYIILDDFVDTGETVRRIAAKLNLLADNSGVVRPECVGVICYKRDAWVWGDVCYTLYLTTADEEAGVNPVQVWACQRTAHQRAMLESLGEM